MYCQDIHLVGYVMMRWGAHMCCRCSGRVSSPPLDTRRRMERIPNPESQAAVNGSGPAHSRSSAGRCQPCRARPSCCCGITCERLPTASFPSHCPFPRDIVQTFDVRMANVSGARLWSIRRSQMSRVSHLAYRNSRRQDDVHNSRPPPLAGRALAPQAHPRFYTITHAPHAPPRHAS
jgi:hypothetical protein